MKIDLTKIYADLKEWREERKITAQSQKDGYLVNIMEEFGELAEALRDYEKIKKGEQVKKKIISDWHIADNNIYSNSLAQYITLADAARELIKYKEVTLTDAEHAIIDALCDIAVFTINAGGNIPYDYKLEVIDTTKLWNKISYDDLLIDIGEFGRGCEDGLYFNEILRDCCKLSMDFNFDFEIAMLETIKEISSRTGSYDEASKKWVKDESPEAKSKWHKADFEKARSKNENRK